MRTPSEQRRRRAFTLVEVLLVLVILVIIGSLAVTAYGPIQRKANINAAKAQIESLESTLRFYRADLNDYPSTNQGLEALVQQPSDLADPGKWQGPYLESDVPLDPWGNPYQYEYPGRYSEEKPDIWSFGPDGVNGTDDDIGNWPEASGS
ncbi:MAG TPA: type II secretion system protein GspG [Planctomycetaceae bacterium]|nr:type II secretion system protein GspG [Planctomycetaceae bacterium]